MGNPLIQMFNRQNAGNDALTTLITILKTGGNPQAVLNSMAAQNPKIGEALQLLQGKSSQDMENICRNLCKQKGIDFDSTLQQVQKLIR